MCASVSLCREWLKAARLSQRVLSSDSITYTGGVGNETTRWVLVDAVDHSSTEFESGNSELREVAVH